MGSEGEAKLSAQATIFVQKWYPHPGNIEVAIMLRQDPGASSHSSGILTQETKRLLPNITQYHPVSGGF